MERDVWRSVRTMRTTLLAGRQRAALAALALLLGVVFFHGSLRTAPTSPSGACTGLTWVRSTIAP